MNVSAVEELFVGELRDLYHAEKQLVEALPKLVEEAAHPALKATLARHLETAKAHVEKLVEVFELLDIGKRAKRCEAMQARLEAARRKMVDVHDLHVPRPVFGQ